MRKIIALATKDLRLLVRDRAGFIFVFFFPLVYCMFFGAIFSGSGGGGVRSAMKIAVVDEDGTEGSRAFIKTLEDAAELEVTLTDRATGRDAVRRGKLVAFVVLPEGFGASVDNPFTGGMPKLETGIDPARRAEAGMLQGLLTQYTYLAIKETLTDRTKMKHLIADSLAGIGDDEELDPVMRATLQLFLPALDSFITNLPEGDGGLVGSFGQVAIDQADVAYEKTG
ncbi:MAG: ABC transporter permease, partial [Planctomycetes bacterium]|nr:ABC transporter permease [Planctomycetota bacterium]